ncbi:MAG TPA: hypothetical protein VE262_15535 [Blastocatellia bacterium]|nr:hypothetical protein [Blastocatellia bacterium]
MKGEDLTGAAPDAQPEQAYQPLASIWEGTDAELLEEMPDFYPKKPPQLIPDATVNVGRFWRGSTGLLSGLILIRPTALTLSEII